MSQSESYDDVTDLRRRHRKLDTTVKKKANDRMVDNVDLTALKREKLKLKEQLHAAGAA